MKSLDRKLAAIHADPSGCREFILADAKDADMAFGVAAPGRSPESHAAEGRFRTLADYREQIREIVRQGIVDICLMSASTNEVLTIKERLFDDSGVTPAARANDATDVWVVRGAGYPQQPARPFRTARLDQIQCGQVDCGPDQRTLGADLGLYSCTFNNRLEDDLRTLEVYNEFRAEAERKGFRHFLEVFAPNAPHELDAAAFGRFVNDHIARGLAGVPSSGRPIFLKIQYLGPAAMEELVAFDPHLVVGILGGGAGTTYDAFKLLAEARKYGARAALFGRKINNAEHQLAFVQILRLIADGEIEPEEAVRAYHGVLQALGVRPRRSLEDDLQLQTNVMGYGGRSSASVPSEPPTATKSAASGTLGPITARDAGAASGCGCGGGKQEAAASPPESEPNSSCNCGCGGSQGTPDEPDFAVMSQAEKRRRQQAKRDQVWGRF